MEPADLAKALASIQAAVSGLPAMQETLPEIPVIRAGIVELRPMIHDLSS